VPGTAPTHPPLVQPSPLPEVPEGWQIGPPDFVGVGTMKSGTTWWWSILSRHPDVAETASVSQGHYEPSDLTGLKKLYSAKEFHFFDHYRGVEEIDPTSYYRYFPRPPGSIAGEWTPRYMYDFWTPPMLRKVAPEAKLLVMLRDPVERYMSGLATHHAFGHELDPLLLHHQFSRGLYGHQLHTLGTYFDRDQILVLQYEQCMADPTREAKRTFAFLGLDPDRWVYSEDMTRTVGASYPRLPMDEASRRALRRAYRADLALLLSEFPELDASLWPTAAG
jgi:hypothetical protein